MPAVVESVVGNSILYFVFSPLFLSVRRRRSKSILSSFSHPTSTGRD
jgi:hypothetical protein